MPENSAAVFLSYASQDAAAARRIAEALRAAGVEVWFDQSELRGGDAWDAKIRRQIKDCTLFVPIISANTNSRPEGYFRLEWKLAVDRSHLLADDHPFLFPVVIDETADATARVPEKFREVQWTRLKLEETPTELANRVARLLSGAAGRRVPAPAPGNTAGTRARNPSRRFSFVSLLLGGLAIVVAGAVAFLVLRPRRSPEEIAKVLSQVQTIAEDAEKNSGGAPPAPPQTEARQLVAKARHLFEAEDDSNLENLRLAEDLLRQAEKLDPFDGEVWAAHAQLSGKLIDLGYDRSDQRRADMRMQAERAVKLVPDSTESQLANAWYLTEQQTSLPAGEQALAALVKRAPGDWRPLLLLGQAAEWLGRPDESIGWYDRAAAIPAGAAIAKLDEATYLFNVGRFDEAKKAMDESIALRPLGRALLLKLRAQELWWGDLDGGKQTVERMPSSLLLDDKGAFMAFRLWLWRREPDQALTVVRGLSHDFLEDAQFYGPKAILVAAAEKLAGRTDLARADWALALRQLDERLQTSPNNRYLLYHRAHCLVELGRAAEAEEAIRAFEQSSPYGPNMWPGGGPGGLLAELGHTTEALDYLEHQLTQTIPLFISRAVLSLNPDFDPLRRNPRFQQILARAPGPAKTAAPAAGPAPVESTGPSPISQLPPASSPTAADSKSVAVLAFTNLSDDKDNEYFSDGISEDLLNLLGKVPGLRVAARASAFSFKGKDATAQEMGQKLNVAYLVDGSVQRSGANVRVVSRLSRADTGEQIWSDKFDGDLKNIFALQDEIAAKIAENLQLKLDAPTRAARSVNPEAYRLYLLGRHQWEMNTEAGTNRAVQCFEQAIQLDPNFALAYCGLADTYNYFGGFTMPGREAWQKEIAQAQKALALEPDLADAHVSLGIGLINAMRLHDAELAYNRAVELNPNSSLAYDGRAFMRMVAGRCDEAVVESRKSVELDPLSEWMNGELAMFLYLDRRFDEAQVQAQRALELHPDSVWADQILGCIALARGKPDAAIARLQAVLNLDPSPSNQGDLGHAYATSGHRTEAEKILNQMKALGQQHYVTPSVGLKVCLGFGEMDAAFAWLEKCSAVQDPVCWYINADPRYDRLRADPRCRALLIKAGLTDDQLK